MCSIPTALPPSALSVILARMICWESLYCLDHSLRGCTGYQKQSEPRMTKTFRVRGKSRANPSASQWGVKYALYQTECNGRRVNLDTVPISRQHLPDLSYTQQGLIGKRPLHAKKPVHAETQADLSFLPSHRDLASNQRNFFCNTA
jgi:hypothetical protein